MRTKVIKLSEAEKISAREKRKRKAVVTVNGSFDILHPGHIEFLRQAKKQGDVLIVLMNSDKSVRLYKGPGRPVNDEGTRARVMAAIRYVDYVALFDEINPKKALVEIKPSIHVNGSDWGKNCIEREVVERYGGKICVVKLKKGYSTTKLLSNSKRKAVRAVFLDRDKTINYNKQGFLHRIEDFEFLPGAIFAISRLSKSKYKIIIATNQSGIGRGIFKRRDSEKLHKFMLKKINQHQGRIDKIYICPHHPDDGCDCRKPRIGMVLKATRDFGLDLNHSWFVGDKEIDVMTGREANLRTIKLGKKMTRSLKLEPNYYAENLSEAVNIILSHD